MNKIRYDSYCPGCGKKFGKGDTIRISKERIDCCNICEPLQPLQNYEDCEKYRKLHHVE